MKSLEQTILDIVQNQLLGLDVREPATFEDHGFDSLDVMNIVMSTEDELGISIDDKDVSMDMTILQYMDFVKGIVDKNMEEATTEEVN